MAALLALTDAAHAQDEPSTLPAPDSMAVQPDPSDFVGRTDSTLLVLGAPHRFAGINVPWLGLLQQPGQPPRPPTAYETHDIFATVNAMDSGLVRAASLGLTAGCAACMVMPSGALNPGALAQIDNILRVARDEGIKLIIPLTGAAACPGGNPPDPVANAACAFAAFHHLDGAAFYTDPGLRAAFAAAVTRLLNHLNPLTGLLLKDDPIVLAWENCDACGQGTDPRILADWTEFVGHTIKATGTRQLYENGAFSGRLGKGAGDVPAALLPLPSVDIVGDRVMPGTDATGAGLAAASRQVAKANRVFLIDAYGWAPAQWAKPDDLGAFLKAVVKNRDIAAAFMSNLSGHAGAGGYLPSDPASAAAGAPLYFPGTATPAASLDEMSSRARAVRRFSFGMIDSLTLPFSNARAPQIISAEGGHIVWRGAAGATVYSIARSPDITAIGSWQTICDKCVSDAQGNWQDPAPPGTPAWYRMLPYNANDHSGMYSAPVKGK